MEQALSLARLAVGQTSPNPAVGAVVVKDDAVVGRGYTQPPGAAHAEILALNEAGEKAKGGTIYITLEPCCHQGKTAPCTEAIIAAGIAEVHMAIIDPNPLVNGKGKIALEGNGIRVILGECESEAKQINEAYIKYIVTEKPFVIAKFAISLDGKIATKTGDSRWISSSESRKYVHSLRYAADAIMVGVNTILTDDPQLTCRCCGGRGGINKKQPLRVIVDSNGRTPPTAKVLNESGNTLIALSRSATQEEVSTFSQVGAELAQFSDKEGLIDLGDLLDKLGSRQITCILVEGGGQLLGSLFDQGLVDKVIVFIAPIIIGGKEAKSAVVGQGIEKLTDALRLKRINFERCADDLVITGYARD